MSASLVGSEMCIRDRAAAVRLPGRRVRACRSIDRLSPGAIDAGSSSPPVSYTHLTLPTICSV
eukprot:6640513-Alexandrium_andersonii.AAC.1